MEKSLHAALKQWYFQPQDELEKSVDGYKIDIYRRGCLIEIQTQNFSSIKHKLIDLIQHHKVHLVHPIANEKWIIKQDRSGRNLSRRKSPKKGKVEHIFNELIHFPSLISDSNFSIEVLLTQEEVVWIDDKKGSWRRKKWSILDRHLIKVIDSISFSTPSDFVNLLPSKLADPFTNRQLSRAHPMPYRLAQRTTYCLRKMGAIIQIGKQGNSILYTIN
jgi:hypothetical protein